MILKRLLVRKKTEYNSFVNKLILIDGNAILHRAFHALPPLTTKTGEPINAVYGLVSMFIRVITDLKPDGIAVAFDEKEKTFRHKTLPAYQSQRPPTAKELLSQFDKAKLFFKACRIPIYSKSGYEADDVIGTITAKAGENVVIVTGDRDQLQLVNDKRNIKLYMPIVGITNAKLYGEAEVKERLGVPPNLVSDFKALVGDQSDNYPGVPGIGPKTAITLLEKYGSFENIYKNLDKIPDGVRKKLLDGKKLGELSKNLAVIVCDVPIEIDFEKMFKWKIDSNQVLNLFSVFGFKTLSKRIKDVGKKIESEKQASLF